MLTGRATRALAVTPLMVAAGVLTAVPAAGAPVTAGIAPPGTGVGAGPPPTLRPWIVLSRYESVVVGTALESFRVTLTGAGFPVDALDAQGRLEVGMIFTVDSGRVGPWGYRIRVRLAAGFDCANPAVLDDTCRFYGAGELRPVRTGVGTNALSGIPRCGERLTVDVFAGEQTATASLPVPCP